MKVFDVFMFHNEFDLLRIHLRELWNVVDHFILVEGDKTHTGKLKPFYFEENKSKFSEFSEKLLACKVFLPGTEPEPWFGWGREIYQRSWLNKELEGRADPDDVILSVDVDEIARPSVIEGYRRDYPCSIEMKNLHYNLNTQLELPTLDPKIARYRTVREIGVSDLRYCHSAMPIHAIQNGGWHLSFMGGTTAIIEKMKSYAHYDIRDPKMTQYVSRENVESSVRSRRSLFMRDDVKYRKNEDLTDLPKRILENFAYFRDLGWVVDF